MPKPPSLLLSYLTTTGSLTAFLEERAGQPLEVQVISERLQPLSLAQKKLLTLPIHRPALAKVRTVLLFGDTNKAWVKASSIFPLPSLQGDAKRLGHLKTTPIGYVLFKKNRQLPHRRTIFFNGTHWGRDTVYDWHGRKILVQELFLDDFKNLHS